MKKADQITGAILLALSVYISTTGFSLDLWWGDEGPGPGFLPFFAGITLALTSSILIYSTFKKDYKNQENIFPKEGLKLLVTLIGSAVIAGLLVKIVGMIIAMGLLAGFLVTFLSEEKKLFTTIGMIVFLPLVLYLIFRLGLDVPFPKGILGL
ncbi:MAG: tripartite tricarboxylate transporter TctB family protein [Peptococcales bacterium]|jgi:putative tricarboxylic transport membrane protein